MIDYRLSGQSDCRQSDAPLLVAHEDASTVMPRHASVLGMVPACRRLPGVYRLFFGSGASLMRRRSQFLPYTARLLLAPPAAPPMLLIAISMVTASARDYCCARDFYFFSILETPLTPLMLRGITASTRSRFISATMNALPGHGLSHIRAPFKFPIFIARLAAPPPFAD